MAYAFPMSQYMEHILKLREIFSWLLSKDLGLKREYLASIEYMKSEAVVCHYYLACPKPNMTFGTTKHSTACHIYPSTTCKYRPINEFKSNENPQKYREIHISEYQ
ncbi:Isopenicillin N synthase-like [Sesbania bispinosa]|nr:Isopenicillin N synthase-like [Sesbania bispinosa]